MTSPDPSTLELLSATIATSETLPPVQTSPTSPGQANVSSTLSIEERYGESTQIGVGGMGEIRVTRDQRIGRVIALKRLHPQISSKNALARFVREARIQGQLEHPSIVPVYDLGADRDGATYFTMQRIRGRTLEQILRLLQARHAPTLAQFTRRKLLTMFSSICLTIHYAHNRGVLHRDLKPANIMVGEFGEVYVLDWGIAKVVGQTESIDLESAEPIARDAPPSDPTMTAAGSVMGTLGYMPPEQLRGDIALLDARSDIYALGMILFELLTFERFHGTDDPAAAYYRTLQGHDDLPSRRAADVPPELDDIFRRATALSPAQRFDSARQLSNEIEHFLDGDRDMSRRRELAQSHADRAAAAADASLAAGLSAADAAAARVQALHEITRALALDPQQTQAHATLGKLLTEMPRELPPAVQAVMDRSTHEAQMNGLRFGSLIYLSWIGVIAFVLFMGVKSWAAFTGPTIGVALILMHVARLFYKGAFTNNDTRLLSALTFATIASFSVWLGPFVLVPLATSSGALVFSIQASREDRWFHLLVATLASFVPYLVEFTGLFPPAYTFGPDGLLLHARAVQLSPLWTTVGLAYLSLSFTLVPAYYLGRVRDSLSSAEQKLFLHAWHFEQLTGSSSHDSEPPRAPPPGGAG